MFTKDLTFFDLSATSTHLVAVGGGGDPAYGKRNGILIVKKDELSSGSPGLFYETEDIIRHVKVYEKPKGESEEEGVCEDFPVDEYSEDCDDKASGITESSNEKGIPDTLSSTKTNNPEFFIAAAGISFFYLLKFTGKITLLKKIGFEVKGIYLTHHLIILHSGRLSGFYNAVQNPRVIQARNTPAVQADTHEEYFYKLYRKGDQIVCKRECGTQDIPSNWSNFYVRDQWVYKVLFEGGESSFVFNNKRYSYEGVIPRIFVSGGMLSFYVVESSKGGCESSKSEISEGKVKNHIKKADLEAGSMLVFIRECEVVYKLPRINCMVVSGEYTAAATCKGDIILYKNGIFRSRTYASPIPITGLALDGSVVYYTTLTGEVGKCSVAPSRVTLYLLAALLMVVLGAGIKYWKS